MAAHARAIRGDERVASVGLVRASFARRSGLENALFDAWVQTPVARARLLIEAVLDAADAASSRRGVPKRLRQTTVPPKGDSDRLVARFDGVRLVEDNLVNQRLTTGLLERLGCKVILAENGREAVELAASEHFDLSLMDCHMPEMDGFEATRTIRAREAGGSRLPIIALTADAMQGDRERCLASGMDDCLSKPIRQQELRDALARWRPRFRAA